MAADDNNDTSVCVVCFEKTAILEREDGEVVVCDSCRLDKKEGRFIIKTVLDKDGHVIGDFKEVLVPVPENVEQAEYSLSTSTKFDAHLKQNHSNKNYCKLYHEYSEPVKKCDDCDYQSDRKYNLEVHKINKHGAVKRNQFVQKDDGSCEICQSTHVVQKHRHYGIMCCHSCK